MPQYKQDKFIKRGVNTLLIVEGLLQLDRANKEMRGLEGNLAIS